MKSSTLALVMSALVVTQAIAQGSKLRSSEEPRLHHYEPSKVGVTKDTDDLRFLDFQLSFRFPVPKVAEWIDNNSLLVPDSAHLAFTTRLAQYIKTRDSAPVVGKRFNPKGFVRWDLGEQSHLDIGYAHESNGMSIADSTQYDAELDNQRRLGQRQTFALDQISRGWDYFEARVSIRSTREERGVSLYTGAMIFVDRGGFFQDTPEEYTDFEPSRDVKRRKDVHGLWSLIKWYRNVDWCAIQQIKLVGRYETGIADPFYQSSWRGELTMRVNGWPVQFWVANGYNSDLAQYNARVRSLGLALEFKPFFDEIRAR